MIDEKLLLDKFNDSGIQIDLSLPVEEVLGEDVDLDDFAMLVQDAIMAYKKMVIDTIKNQPKVGEWIPCSERLPDEGGVFYPICLVTLDNGDVCLGVYRWDDKAWWTRMSCGETKYSTSHGVLAWMPLPEPYKEEGDE